MKEERSPKVGPARMAVEKLAVHGCLSTSWPCTQEKKKEKEKRKKKQRTNEETEK